MQRYPRANAARLTGDTFDFREIRLVSTPMKEFIRGWRRKAGCVTLMLALLLITGWIGSLRIGTGLVIQSPTWTPNTSATHVLLSCNGSLSWMRHGCRFPTSDTVTALQWPLEQTVDHPFTSEIIRWHRSFRWCGFESGEGAAVGFPITSWRMPYWPVTVLLTLLSASLMLIPSRERTLTEARIQSIPADSSGPTQAHLL